MSYAELISRLSALPVERRVQLFDFKNLFESYFDLITGDAHACADWGHFSQDAAAVYDESKSRLH